MTSLRPQRGASAGRRGFASSRGGPSRSIFIVATVAEQLAVQYPQHISLLAGMGVSVEVFAGDFPEGFEGTPGLICHRIPVKRLLDPAGALTAAAVIQRRARRVRPRAILYGSPSAAVVGALGGRVTVPHRIFVVHGLREETLTGARRAVMTNARRLSERLSTQVIYVSDSLRRRAEQLDGGARSRRRVAPGGFVGTALPTALASRSPEPGETVVGFVGRLARDKGVPELVRSITMVRERHPGVRLLLVGDPDATDPVDAETSRRIGADPRIEVVPHVSDVRSQLRRMDVFALPSYREGLPTVVLEAMSEKVPVVGSDATGVDELVTDRTGWRCETGSVPSLAQAITAALDRPDDAVARAEAAWTDVANRYAVDPVMRWWRQLYEDIFDADGQRAPLRAPSA